MERAYALRDARENERKSIVKKKYDDQWRDACDDARTLDSKAMTIFMNKERIRQIEEKRERKIQLSSQENAFVDEWTRQMDALAARDEAKKALRKKIDAETSAQIREQVRRTLHFFSPLSGHKTDVHAPFTSEYLRSRPMRDSKSLSSRKRWKRNRPTWRG